MTLEKPDPVTDESVPAPTRGGAPVYRYDSASGRWLDNYLDDGLVAYWPLGTVHTGSGTALDGAGNGTDLPLYNGVTTGDAAPVTEGYTFDGTDDRAEGAGTPLDPSSIGQDITVCCWFRLNNERTTATTRRVVAAYNNWRPGYGLNLQSGEVPNEISTCIAEADGFNGDISTTVEEGRWYHVTYRMIGESMVDLHVDGEFIGEGSIAGLEIGDGYTFKLGGHPNHDRECPITLSDVRVYNRALGSDELSALYQQGRPASIPGRVGHWPLGADHIASGDVLDVSGSGDRGTMTGGVTTDIDSPTGGALRFDGVDDEVHIPTDDTLSEATWSVWVNPQFPASHPDDRVVFAKGSYSNLGTYFNPATQTLRVFANSVQEVNLNDFSQNEWVHVVGTYDSNGELRLYADGVYVGNDTEGTSGLSNSEDYYIGNDRSGSYPWLGGIADVRVYDRVLSHEEIQDLYHSSRIVEPACRVGHWSLNDRHTSDGETLDLSPADNDASLSGGVTTGVSSPVGQGFRFDGTDDELTVDDVTGFEGTSEAATLTLWTRAEWSTMDPTDVRLFNTYRDDGGDEWRSYQNENIPIIVEVAGTNHATNAYPGSIPPDNEWIFLNYRWEYDPANDETTVEAGRNGSWYESQTVAGKTQDPHTIAIGEWKNNYFPGDISDVRFFDRRLTDREVQSVYETTN